MAAYLEKKYNDVVVSYTKELNGGGISFGDDYVDLFKSLAVKPPVGRIFEWCSGPGFIGYALLANRFGSSLCLSDIYSPSVEAARHTAKENNLEDVVRVYEGDGVLVLPENEKFDLVVGNPPHFPERNMIEFFFHEDQRIYLDKGWRLHRQFFANIRKHLTQNGQIILLENSWGSHIDTFREMIENNGMRIAGWQWCMNQGKDLWYLSICRDDATLEINLKAS
jgi:methylase of polypeptide subunit release factors